MRTREQANRDAALRRLTQVNRSLAIAAAVGAGVVTDIVANTASAHAHTTTSPSAKGVGSKPSSPGTQQAGARAPGSAVRHRTASHHHAASSSEKLRSSSAPSAVTSSSSSGSSSSSAVSSAPTVVAVSGGS